MAFCNNIELNLNNYFDKFNTIVQNNNSVNFGTMSAQMTNIFPTLNYPSTFMFDYIPFVPDSTITFNKGFTQLFTPPIFTPPTFTPLTFAPPVFTPILSLPNFDYKFLPSTNTTVNPTPTPKSDFSKEYASLEYKPQKEKKYQFTTYNRKTIGNIDNSYTKLNQAQATQKARKDSNLEELRGGKNWKVANTFHTDIPFAKKGTSAILQKVAQEIGEDLVITSALGTGEAKNPHKKGGYASHHNAENPKLDIATNGHGTALAQKLRNTGYFSRVSLESDHLDVQIDINKFKKIECVA